MYVTVQTTQRRAIWLWLGVMALFAAMPAMAQLTLSPTSASVTVGGTQQFTATPATNVLWSVDNVVATGSTVSNTGLFTAGAVVGTVTVRAQSSSGTATAQVTVTPMAVSPATVTMVSGQTQVFTVQPASAAVTWVASGNDNAISSPGGVFTAGASPGTFTVTATSGTYGTATATVTIAPLVISPATVSLSTGATQQFTANPSTNVTWSVSTGGGAISSNGLYTAPNTAGTYTITATRTSGAVIDTATATVTVTVPLAVSPATATLGIGNTQQFTVTPATAGITWSLTPASSNTVSLAGLFTAAAAGTYTLTATAPGGQTATAAITVTSLVITPLTATVARGGTQDFNANPSAGVTWTVSPTGQGVTIGTNGTVTVTATATIGVYTVTATSTANGTATATLTVGGSGTITIAPSTAQVLPGGTQQFTATPGTGVTWSVTGGGSITNGGLYTAPATAPGGPVTITATSTSGTGTATVTVAPLIITPATVSLKPGETQLFVANPPTGVTWTVSTGGGSISTSGLYTAPSTPGTYTITATSAAGTTTATVNVTSLVVSPPSATILTSGTVQFTATPSTGVVWSVSGGGTIDNAGKFTAGTTPGSFTITATSTNGVATATVEVKNPPLAISPLVAMVLPSGTQQFNISPSGASVTWTVSGGGSISNTGLFTANTNEGSYIVTATSATETATAEVVVTPLAISPAYVILRPNASQQFNANPSAGVQWRVEGAGTVTTSGRYTAPSTPGTYKVWAYSPTLDREEYAEVVVAEAGLLISPASVTLGPDDVQQFTATPPDGVVWTCTGGTIDNAGVFKAGDVAGTFTVTANSSYGSATATVTISQTANVPGYEAVPDAYNSLLNPVGRAGVGTLRSLVGETVNAVGSWHFGSTGGDPLTPADDSFSLVDRVLAYLYIAGESSEFEVGASGKVLVQPYKDDTRQVAGFTWSTDDPQRNFTVEFTLSLVRDVLHWQYRITNKNLTTKRVGFRVNAFMKYLGKTGDRYTLPDGNTYNTVHEYVGQHVPDTWSVRYTPGALPSGNAQPVLRAQQVLRRGYTGPSDKPAPTTPARLVFASEDALQQYDWPYIERPTGDSPIVPDTAFEDANGKPSFAVGAYYFNELLPPGDANAWVVSGEYRYNWSAVETADHYAVAQAGTEWLEWREPGMYVPAEATIRAYVCNSSKMAGTARVTATITPGTGLSLAPGQSATYTNVSVAPLQDLLLRRSASDQYSWKLVPNGMASGLVPVTVEAKFSPGGNVISSVFYVNVPAAPQTYYERGIHFTGFPFELANPDPRVALGLGNMVDCAYFDPGTQRFRYSLQGDRIDLLPAQGYWLRLMGNTAVTLRDATPIPQSDSYSIDLSPRWNAISNPFQYGIDWAKCKVYYRDKRYTMAEAIAAQLVGAYLWQWDSHANQYHYTSQYSSAAGDTLGQPLQPYVGYWVYAYEPVGLIFTPNPYVPAMTRSASAPPARQAGRADQWQVNIVAQTASARDAITTFGVKADASSRDDVLEPPMGIGGLSASFVKRGTRGAEHYAVALSAPEPVMRWSLDVSCVAANETVSLSWPDLTQFPAGANLVLIDELTGKQVSMRGAPSYTFNSGPGGARRFTVVAGGEMQRLQILRAQATGGTGRSPVTFAVDTSMAANVTVRIRTLTGALVRELAAPAAGATTSVVWDGLTAQGRRAGPGLYSCEVYAEAPDGQRVRSVVTVQIR